jgi:hypothetical protein
MNELERGARRLIKKAVQIRREGVDGGQVRPSRWHEFTYGLNLDEGELGYLGLTGIKHGWHSTHGFRLLCEAACNDRRSELIEDLLVHRYGFKESKYQFNSPRHSC